MTCGPCTACCRIKAVEALGKGCGVACQHQTEHGADALAGCTIYADRPQECADYECGWLISQRGDKPWPEKHRPDQVGLIFDTAEDGRPCVHIDPRRPDAHLTGEGLRLCMSVAKKNRGLRVFHNAHGLGVMAV